MPSQQPTLFTSQEIEERKALILKKDKEVQSFVQRLDEYFGVENREVRLNRFALYEIEIEIRNDILARYGYPN